MAVPITPKTGPPAKAARAPTQTADQFTGQLTVSHRCTPLGSGIALPSCRLRGVISCATTLSRFLAAGLEPWENLGLVELHEAGLVGTNLVHADMVIAGIGVFLERVEVLLGIRSTDHGLRHRVFRDELRHRLEVSGKRQLPGERSVHGLDGPPLPRHLPRLGFILTPAHRELSVAGPTGPRLLAVFAEELLVRLGTDHAVAVLGRDLRAPGPAHRDHDRRRLGRQGIDACVFQRVVRAAIALKASLPELADDLNGLDQPCLADLGLGPSLSDDVLVEVLACPDAEKEAAGHHGGRGGP